MKYLVWLILSVVATGSTMLLANFLPAPVALAMTDVKGSIWQPENYLNVHATIWLAFYYGLFNLLSLRQELGRQKDLSRTNLLNADPDIILEREDRARIYRDASAMPSDSILRQMVMRSLAQYQLSRSWDRASQILQATTEEIQQRTDLKYTLVRYLTWLIPSLGFIGTVVGIGATLQYIGELGGSELANPDTITGAVKQLGMAFSTTLMSLVLSSILIFAVSVWQAAEEELIADSFAHCVDHLLNKLHEDEDGDGKPA